jgi:hypothetical protein
LICVFSPLMKRYIPNPRYDFVYGFFHQECWFLSGISRSARPSNEFQTPFWAFADVPRASELFRDCSSRSISRTLKSRILLAQPSIQRGLGMSPRCAQATASPQGGVLATAPPGKPRANARAGVRQKGALCCLLSGHLGRADLAIHAEGSAALGMPITLPARPHPQLTLLQPPRRGA